MCPRLSRHALHLEFDQWINPAVESHPKIIRLGFCSPSLSISRGLFPHTSLVHKNWTESQTSKCYLSSGFSSPRWYIALCAVLHSYPSITYRHRLCPCGIPLTITWSMELSYSVQTNWVRPCFMHMHQWGIMQTRGRKCHISDSLFVHKGVKSSVLQCPLVEGCCLCNRMSSSSGPSKKTALKNCRLHKRWRSLKRWVLKLDSN